MNGFCFLFGSNLRQPPQRFPKALRGGLCLVSSEDGEREAGGGAAWTGDRSSSGA